MNSQTLKPYKYNGARSLVLLHEQHLTSCLKTWREAKALNVILPKTDDNDYLSLETLIRHILGAAKRYMIWMCKKLELPDPEFEDEPNPDEIELKADAYLAHLLERWRFPLVDVPEEKFTSGTYSSNWGVEYCIDAMLEHAVMHPIRHEFQLRSLCLIRGKENNI